MQLVGKLCMSYGGLLQSIFKNKLFEHKSETKYCESNIPLHMNCTTTWLAFSRYTIEPLPAQN